MPLRLLLPVAMAFAPFSYLPAAELDFNRDVRPILADKCYHCHGPDEKTRKAKLRLDTPEGAVEVLKGARPEESEFIKRITSSKASTRMPPEDTNLTKKLSPAEIAVLKAWVASGGKYATHWAYQPPKQSPLPAVVYPGWTEPIDRFIAARLAQESLKPSSRADKITLIRRVTLDLTGLPPTPAEVEAFLADTSPQAYAKVVDRLLNSPRFGERMAVMWLDLARYGDSSVYHADGPRDMWAWRDWVIRAFNDNMRYDQFTIEQLAGDLLPNATVSQKVASGFNRNHATTDEGGVIPEEFRVDYVVDRVKTASSTWMAMSLECAQCHDHKYDPIRQKEYYQFYAYFNNTRDPGMQTRNGNTAPTIEVEDPDAAIRQKVAQQDRETLEREIAKLRETAIASPAFKEWLTKQKAPADAKPPLTDILFHLGFDEKDRTLGFNDYLGSSASPSEGRAQTATRPGGNGIKLPGNTVFQFSRDPGLDQKTPFTFAAWMKVPANGGGYLLTKMDLPSANYRGFDLGLDQLKPGLHYIHSWPANALKVYGKKALKPDTWQHVAITYDGSGKAAGVRIFIDGELQENQVHNDTLNGTIKAASPLRLGARGDGIKFNGDVDAITLYRGMLTPEEIKSIGKHGVVESNVAIPAEKRTASQTAVLAERFLRTTDTAHYGRLRLLVQKFEGERKVQRGRTTVMIMEDLPGKEMRPTYILNRGQYDQPLKDHLVQPATPAILPAMPSDAPKNRLGLARWLVQSDHPLTSRTAVNRWWQLLFGEGFVRTSEDFGMQGEVPSHLDLLDWLAVDFVKSGWDVKRMLKLIVLSETYCQQSKSTPELRQKDPEDRWLGRYPRRRLQAEFVRDQALFVGGLLNEKVGGPSVRPYQPKGIWEEVAIDIGLSTFVQDKGDKLYRRSMYTYWKRSSPHPTMMTFDAPTREKCTARRSSTNTPLQALVTLNDPQFVEAARAFAQRIIMNGGKTVPDRIQFAFRQSLGRSATEREVTLLTKLAETQLARFSKEPKKAEEMLKIGESPRESTIPAVEHAVWQVIASTILNLDEFLVKN